MTDSDTKYVICDELNRQIRKESANSNRIGNARREEPKDGMGRMADPKARENLTFAQTDCNEKIRELIRQREEQANTHVPTMDHGTK